MKRDPHFFNIQDIHTGLFFRSDGSHYIPDAADTYADFFTREQALQVAQEHYRVIEPENSFCNIVEGSVKNYFNWLSHRAGRTMTLKKQLANAKNAKLPRKRKEQLA